MSQRTTEKLRAEILRLTTVCQAWKEAYDRAIVDVAYLRGQNQSVLSIAAVYANRIGKAEAKVNWQDREIAQLQHELSELRIVHHFTKSLWPWWIVLGLLIGCGLARV